MTQTTSLARLRGPLMALHRALLDTQRREYERLYGRIEGDYTLLGLAASDPDFAWIRPLAAQIVALDDRLAAEEPLDGAEAAMITAGLRDLLTPRAEASGFQRWYHRALQENPAVVLAHGEVMRLLPRLAPNAENPKTESEFTPL